MRNNQPGARYPAKQVGVQQRDGRRTAPNRQDTRGREQKSRLDVTVDVKTADIAGTVRIVSPPGPSRNADRRALESELELFDRATASVVRTLARPMLAEMETDDGLITSTSARARLSISGAWSVVYHHECEEDVESDAARQERLLWRLAAAAVGARFVAETTLGSPVFMENMSLLSPYRTILPTMPQRAKAAKILGDGGSVALGELAGALHPNAVNGRALVYGLMLRRYVAIDLETPLGPDSKVCASVGAPEIMPGLFDLLRGIRTTT
jgi:hypothetical protein